MKLKNNIVISSAVLIFLIFAFGFFLIAPVYSEIKMISKEISQERGKMASLQSQIKNFETLNSYAQKYEKEFQKADSIFVSSEMPIALINFLEDIAQDSSVSLKISSSQQVKEPSGSWPSLLFQVNASGSFPNLSKFLAKLESAPYLMEIQNLRVAKESSARGGSQGSGSGRVEATLSLKVFSR